LPDVFQHWVALLPLAHNDGIGRELLLLYLLLQLLLLLLLLLFLLLLRPLLLQLLLDAWHRLLQPRAGLLLLLLGGRGL
jgi:uncharacterized BrkB/YihY/UPF0761 family membrane protein